MGKEKKKGFEFVTLFIILACVSFFVFVYYASQSVTYGYPEWNPAVTGAASHAGFSNLTGYDNATSTYKGFVDEVTSNVASLAGAGAILLGTVFYPNPYLIFAGALLFLAGFLDLPAAIIGSGTGMPIEFSNFFIFLISFFMVLALWSWYKGQASP